MKFAAGRDQSFMQIVVACLFQFVLFLKTRLFQLLLVGRIPQPPGNKTRALASRGSYIVLLVTERLLVTVLGLAPDLRMGDLG